jgi:hypothetical protein
MSVRCPRCGSGNVVGYMGEWECMNCGYKFKLPTPPTYYGRPSNDKGKWVAGLILALIIGLLLGCLLGYSSSPIISRTVIVTQTIKVESPTTIEKTHTITKATEVVKEKTVTVTVAVTSTTSTISEKRIVAHVGENLRLGNYQVSILSVKEAEYVKLGENYYKPREGMKFLILRVNVLNVEEHVEMCPCWGILPTEWCPFGRPVLITDKGWAYDWESLPGEWIPPEHVTEEVKKNAVECSIFPAGKSLAPNTYCEGDIFFESPLNENPVKIVFEPLPHYTVEIVIHSA